MADRNRALLAFILIAGLSGTLATHAEDGSQGWLRYAPPSPGGIPAIDPAMPASIVNLDSSAPSISAQNEILRGVRSMLGRTLRIEPKITHEDAWVLGTTEELHAAFPQYRAPTLDPEGFSVSLLETQGHHEWLIAGADPRGILYGAFHVLSGIARGENFTAFKGSESPAAPIRWVNQWDNLNGTIERGYAGRSIFFDERSRCAPT